MQAIQQSKLRPSEQILVSGIFGWSDDPNARYRIDKDPTLAGAEDVWTSLPVCESAKFGKSYAGLRLKAFVDAFGENGQVNSLCNEDVAPALKQFGAKLRAKLTPGCIDQPLIDTSQADGLQPDCRVEEHVPEGSAYAKALLPACDGTGVVPCWYLDSDPQCRLGVRMRVDYGVEASGARTQPPSGTLLKVTCRLCPDTVCAPSWETDQP